MIALYDILFIRFYIKIVSFLSSIRRPYPLGPGWFDWIKPVFKIKDNSLLENIGFDAFTFIYFTRILRRLIIVLTLISMFIFLPVTIVATYTTGYVNHHITFFFTKEL
jgi:hypothetical protein